MHSFNNLVECRLIRFAERILSVREQSHFRIPLYVLYLQKVPNFQSVRFPPITFPQKSSVLRFLDQRRDKIILGDRVERKSQQRMSNMDTNERIVPHSPAWYDRLATLQEGYHYPWQSQLGT